MQSVCRGLLACWLIVAAGCTRQAAKGEIQFADGLEQLALGDTLRALQLFDEARWLLGNDHRVLFHIGRLQAASQAIAERVQARETLQQAIDRSPESARYKETLGELLQRQRYPYASTQMLCAAVAQDPSLSRAWFLLGDNLRRQYFLYQDEPVLLDSAMNCYASALMHDPEDRQAAYNLAFLNMHSGSLQIARRLILPLVAQSACPDRYGMLLTAIEYRAQRFDRASEVAERTLRCMGWPERQRWVGLHSIVLPDSIGWWEDRTPAQRDSLAQWFWWSVDPTPTSLVNERLLEHLTRVVEADFYFSVPTVHQEGCTSDRGEIWLRYGEPKMTFRVYGRDQPAWRWIYGAVGGSPYGAFFDFIDPYLNDNYLRVRRGTRADFSYAEMIDVVPQASRLHFRPPPGGLHYQMRYFRGGPGRTAVEIAFAVDAGGDWRGLLVEAAAWRGPHGRAAHRGEFTPREQLLQLADGRLLGRMRFEVPAEELVLGLQVRAANAAVDAMPAANATWMATGRDTLAIEDLHSDRLAISDIILAYEIVDHSGGIFDKGGIQVQPRVDARIEGKQLKMYFEVYPSKDMLVSPRPIAVRYTVRPRAPESFSFWEQFNPGARRRWHPDELPSVQATYRFVPESPIEAQHLRIDVSVLERGPYELRIELEDPVTRDVASRVVPFLLTVESEL